MSLSGFSIKKKKKGKKENGCEVKTFGNQKREFQIRDDE